MASPSSSDEGEIVETNGVGVGDSKATSLPQIDRTGVDRPDRNRARHSRSRTPEYGNDTKFDHNARSPRGFKRSRNDDDFRHNGRLNPDPRRFRVHYEDARDEPSRSRFSYDDEVKASSRSSTSGLRYDDRDRDRARNRDPQRDHSRDRDHYPEKRPRKRSRSPYRPPRGGSNRGDRSRRDDDRHRRPLDRDVGRGIKYGHQDSPQHSQDHAVSKRATSVDTSSTSKHDAKFGKGHSDEDKPAKAPAQGPEQERREEPLDVEAEIERRRRRREELLAKSRGPTPMLVQALHACERTAPSSPAHTQASTPGATDDNTPRSAISSPSSPAPGLQEGMSPAVLDISSDQELINTHGKSGATDEDGPSAADYDPTADMREDEMRDERRHGLIGPHGEVLPLEQKAEIALKEEPQPTKNANDEDDDFDMFADDFDEEKFAAPKSVAQVDNTSDDRKLPATLAQPNGGGILEGDDKEGYYKIRIGEIMNGRYQVQSTLGKGMFSGVARAVDITSKKLVAIKMMHPENRKHIVKFERHFEHKGHLCLAFENLSLNLREVLRKFGNNVGINLSATRAYAHQMFVALAHMRKCTIIHADIKPDNILVNETRNILKICDLGTAIDRSDAATAHTEITPYLVSRFYRAPEIILGMPYDYAVDMWSIGCTLYELYTGKILFTGDSNNQMLKAIMEIRGKFSTKLYKRGQLSHMHFDDMGNFISVERDKALGKTNIRALAVVKPTRDLRTRLTAASGGMNESESRDLNHFIDLLERCLALNPDKRMTPSEALKHPFFMSRVGAPAR
ncbi:kinase-like domain-containing protein [Pseudomassariella vexata]|uniref:non-specific serine/threonine protein kinase n=1 Tax=Pseudomassariella vexata TaxID=1141098 RepID=A0A1Y2E3I7_9PEZI|nr:kinase-like domain-containing protein [Pseudomassariella vexata]ORY66007.1 kinase-like domain-containing protein [Pseudomassariella vexata]